MASEWGDREKGAQGMTYCIGVMLDRGMVFASDSRTMIEVAMLVVDAMRDIWGEGTRQVFRHLPELAW